MTWKTNRVRPAPLPLEEGAYRSDTGVGVVALTTIKITLTSCSGFCMQVVWIWIVRAQLSSASSWHQISCLALFIEFCAKSESTHWLQRCGPNEEKYSSVPTLRGTKLRTTLRTALLNILHLKHERASGRAAAATSQNRA